MKVAFPRSAALVPVCRQAGLRLAAYRAGGAERAERAEGKIKETGTRSARFLKLLLSAHWLDGPRAAPHFLTSRAAILRKALALLDFGRHYSRRKPDFLEFWPEAHP
ncbi:hypothetical protein [Pseudomonas aeruginosa]|uniref:hypothetical protein n=1 Tax=Pseudomonas aeruginosa TaxID=287 RepID=UPI00259C6C94|nr:hypothetical protein [Pseudomonas aeruginosa]MDM4790301.1 hypothetical protein [Pseudomonas aeruginosa]MDM4792624.1 hypothetical protein [Pseudomonas aeruginosa]MDM4835746.1 hypothetical protein [Pseudomonas aeruginosa]MDM4851415.1 hypothetical protein [Pseudomonas aeruginosa]MDM5014653.1 hypothetical protein [Pseudomonas aeruginosa]